MPRSPSISSDERGFVFTLDMAIALTLVLSVLFLTQTVPFENNTISAGIPNQQVVDDLFTFLDTSGYMLYTLDTNAPSQAVGAIYNRAISSLPAGMELRVQLQQFTADDLDICYSDNNFSTCFPDANTVLATAGTPLPVDIPVLSGKKVFVRRQPPADCNLSYAEAAAPNPFGLNPFSQNGQVFDSHPFPTFLFQEPDLNLVFDVNVVPSSQLSCDENVMVNLSVVVPEFLRNPVDVMLVMDTSGSMAWVGRLDTSDGSRLDVNGGYTYLADGSGDLRVIDTSSPGLPVLTGSESFSGSGEDVLAEGDYAYVAAGNGSLKVVDISNKAAPNQVGSWDVSSSGRGIDKAGDYVFLAHGNSGIRVIDVSTPSIPSLTSTWNSPDYAYDVKISGDYAYVADDDSGLIVLDVSDPSSPSQVAQCESTAPCDIDGGTNSLQVFILGTYLYLSQSQDGMRIIDISDPSNPSLTGTYDPTDTVNGIFVRDNNAYLATGGGGLQVVDVTNKAAPSLLYTYDIPYDLYDVEVEGGWAYLAAGSYGLFTIDLLAGTKMTQAITAAQGFADANSWEATDQMGLVSYDSSATLEVALSTDRNAVLAALAPLTADGGTATGDGIYEATAELTGPNANPQAFKFQVLLSDGQTNAGSNSATAAQDAANNGIVIYSIGFGPDADATELTTIATLTGGEYYAASDVNVLATIFDLIEEEIQEAATNATVNAVVSDANFVVDSGGATLVDQNLLFDANTVSPGQPWFGSYTLNFPCTNQLSCTIDSLSFPGAGSYFEYTDSNGTHRINFDVNTTVSFLKRDLAVDITSGVVTAPDTVLLDVNVANVADLNTGSTTLNFYLNDINTTPLTSRFVPELCGGTNSFCTPSYQLYLGSLLNTEGVIYATVNDDNSLSECPGNNVDVINCFGAPETLFYVLDYWVWRA